MRNTRLIWMADWIYNVAAFPVCRQRVPIDERSKVVYAPQQALSLQPSGSRGSVVIPLFAYW